MRQLCFGILLGIQYERPWLKGQMSTLTFETYSEQLGLTDEARKMTLPLTVIKKIIFQINSHLNALGSKFDLDVE